MVEKESNTTPNMIFKHCAMLAIIILAKTKVSLANIKNGEKLQTSFWGTSKCHI
jgi:hypothetical protein